MRKAFLSAVTQGHRPQIFSRNTQDPNRAQFLDSLPFLKPLALHDAHDNLAGLEIGPTEPPRDGFLTSAELGGRESKGHVSHSIESPVGTHPPAEIHLRSFLPAIACWTRIFAE